MKLAELLHFCLTAKRTGLVSYTGDTLEGWITIIDGEVASARYGENEGEDAFFTMLLREKCEVSFQEKEIQVPRTIHQGTQFLLLEGAKRADEAAAAAHKSPQENIDQSEFGLAFITLDNALFSLGTETVIIGRSNECDITVPDVSVSGRHCRILWNGKNHLLDDLDSFNGTYLNGAAMTAAKKLRVGDLIQVGLCHFQYIPLSSTSELSDPKVAVPFTFGSETQKIQLPVRASAVASEFKSIQTDATEPNPKNIWPFGRK
ncbi:MAG: FHA domain-containing protein [Candidatus Methylacidiphilales bacterium]